MWTQALVFLGTDTGKSVVRYVLGVGMPLVISFALIFVLYGKYGQLEVKVDNLNNEAKQNLRFQVDTLYHTLEKTNRFLEQFEPPQRDDDGKRNSNAGRRFF
jgi:hypothetical protein